MPHNGSVEHHASASEPRDIMRFSAWLLACALLLEENSQQLRQRQAHKERVEYAT